MSTRDELAGVLADTLNKCELDKNEYLIKVSNRKLIQGLLEELKIKNDSKKLRVIRAADKLDRVGIAGVKNLLGKSPQSSLQQTKSSILSSVKKFFIQSHRGS